MFLRCKTRYKDGKEHQYWSIVENKRVAGGRTIQRHVLHLGELNTTQEESWRRSVDLFFEEEAKPQQAMIFPEDYLPEQKAEEIPTIGLRLAKMRLERPRQWGACWLGTELWKLLGLDEFWSEKLPDGRKGARWDQILQTLTLYRLIDPGSEWRLHRHWFEHSALGDLLGSDFSLAEIHRLYECHDKLIKHKEALFNHLTERWKNLFDAKYEVLLYDLTSTYFERDPIFAENDKRKFGYSRDKRSDCVQVVIALIVTPEGFPLAYEVLPGNTSDKTTLKDFLEKIEHQYGKADRIWVMDRGIPTEKVLAEMKAANRPIHYLVGTPRGRLGKMEASFLELSWQQARTNVEVKLCPEDGETYILAKSKDRVLKERSMRRRRLRKYLKRLAELQTRKQLMKRDALHQAIGAAKKEAGSDARHVEITVKIQKQKKKKYAALSYRLNRASLRLARRREGCYLLRTNLTDTDPAKLWTFYLQLTEVEQAFKELKNDLSLRPIYHQLEKRIEAHIFISFLAYCLQVTLKAKIKYSASGLTPRSVLEQFATMQMLDVRIPTTDQRELLLTRYTHPSKEIQLLLDQLKLTLPEQAPPKIYTPNSH
jgi:transposase